MARIFWCWVLDICGNDSGIFWIEAQFCWKTVTLLFIEDRCRWRCFVTCALIDMYSKCGGIGDAQWAHDQMPEKTIVGWNSIIAGVRSHWVCIIKCGSHPYRAMHGHLPWLIFTIHTCMHASKTNFWVTRFSNDLIHNSPSLFNVQVHQNSIFNKILLSFFFLTYNFHNFHDF